MRRTGLLLLLLAIKATCLSCRCYPGDSCWPSAQQWSDFNETIGGRLISTVPIGSVCHTAGRSASYNKIACSALLSDWGNPATHYESPSSPMAAWFANFSCDPFSPSYTPCNIGALPQFTVNATSIDHFRYTLQFVQEHNIRLVIRNTGHDYLGKSTGPGALALWTHHLKDSEFLQYNSSSYNGSALRLGAGIQGFEAMALAHANQVVVVTGNCESVGVAGGYTQGGGHGQLASHFGLAADQVLEWDVITASGDHLTVTPSENPDLFWAITGGGGGTYAVVLSVTVKAHPEMVSSAATLTFNGTDVEPDIFWQAVQTFVLGILPLIDAGATAIWTISGSIFSVTPIALPGGTYQQLHDGLASTIAFLDQYNVSYTYNVTQFSTFWDSYTAMNPHSNVTEAQIGGRLMPRSTVEQSTSALISALRNIATQGIVISGVSLNVSRPEIPLNAVNPAWREAAISFVLGTAYDYTNRSADLKNQILMTDIVIPSLTALSPGGGSYLNEADWNQPDWQSVFYGENYNTLEAVKFRYDPNHIFWARTAVGSEKWIQKYDGRLCQAV
ncbi:FAD-linked oxidoreductase sor8 [Penicillium taxi]|uniref:FAD-linked oxidoreductase sor8 n=1 Tax=Penicillium taxi TaxID=168475 RepID=UPI0025453321|nr:FAD-linked oxidoreductase sor8 [Penicillium taxi]KAJ5899376.1 FAD-linked oxidoreductase sor8 [Penicillium taxi]